MDDTSFDLRDSLAAQLAPRPEGSLLDLVDNLLDKGVVLDGEVRLGLAGIDLVTLRLAALLAASDRVDAPNAPTLPRSHAPNVPSVPEVHQGAPAAEAPMHPRTVAPTHHGTEAPVPVPSGRWNAEPENARRAVMQLVLALADFIRQLLERQAVRRMEQSSLSPEETERLGRALMELETAIHDLAKQAGLEPHELNLDLGPLGMLT